MELILAENLVLNGIKSSDVDFVCTMKYKGIDCSAAIWKKIIKDLLFGNEMKTDKPHYQYFLMEAGHDKQNEEFIDLMYTPDVWNKVICEIQKTEKI